MAKPTIQIIIPVYNAEKTIIKCMASLKAQTFEDWQAILVDDASKDNSGRMIEEYAKSDARFVYVKQKVNGGVSKARNTALKMIESEYVSFLDSDDYWEPNMLEVMYSKAKKHDADVVQCRYIYDFPDGKQFLPAGSFASDVFLQGSKLNKVYLRMMTGINMNHLWVKLIKSSIIGDTQFDDTLATAEDLEFCVNVFKKVKSFYFTTNVLHHYCRWGNTLTGSSLGFAEKLKCNRRVSRVILKALPVWNIDNVFYRLLTLLRPYTIIVSKVFRIAREKLLGN